MQEVFDVYAIKFIKKTDIIESIEDGYSGALLYKITRGKDKYFLKVFKRRLDIEKIKESVSIYKRIGIKSLDIIDSGNINNSDRNYIVYNFIEGKNLKIYTNSDEYSLKDLRKIGTKIGKELLKLKEYKEHNTFITDDINTIVDNAQNKFNLLLENEAYKNIIFNYFTTKEINNLRDNFYKYSKIFDNIKPRLIHGDIKRSNIMLNDNKEMYITDIESMQISYDVLNFRHQITWDLFDGNEKEKEFARGYFDGIYSNDRPENFNYSIIFTIILNFYTESYKRHRDSNITEFETYVKKCKRLFNKLNVMDLNERSII